MYLHPNYKVIGSRLVTNQKTSCHPSVIAFRGCSTETAYFRLGVRVYGFKWARILKEYSAKFHFSRNVQSLKDRWRRIEETKSEPEWAILDKEADNLYRMALGQPK